MKRPYWFILFATLIVSGTAWGAFGIYNYYYNLKIRDPKFRLQAIVQKSQNLAQLKTSFLVEALGVSVDEPVSLYSLNLKTLENTLLAYSPIRAVKLEKIPPSTLFIQYELRQPVAILGDLSNTGVDKEGVLFPFQPFYTPKRLPFIYFSEKNFQWGDSLEKSQWTLAFDIIKKFSGKKEVELLSVDLEKLEALSFGEREIVVKLKSFLLRLEARNWAEGIDRFLTLLPFLKFEKDEVLFDFRIPQLALIQGASYDRTH